MKAKVLFILILFLVSCSPKKPAKPEIEWITSYYEGLKLAKKENKIAMVYFYTPWCKYCKNMENITFRKKEVIRQLKKFVCIKVNCEVEKDILEIHRDEILGYPTILFIDNKGVNLNYIVGFCSYREFIKEMKKVLNEE
jgi:thiol:disulfide interchange protein